MSRLHRAVLAIAAMATMGLMWTALPGTAADASSTHPVVSRVSGNTYVLLGPSVFGVTVQQDPLRYSVALRSDNSVQGEWSYRYYEAGVLTTFSGPVTCLTVQGNRAWLGGPIARSSDPTQVGNGAWWQVADNGTGRHPVVPDQTTFAGIGTMQETTDYCATAPAPKHIFDVQLGGVQVND